MDIQQPKQFNVLLIGETCNDVYLYGDVEKISPEAPVPILKYTHTETYSGMSSNVKNNLQSFGINVNHITNKEVIEKIRVVHNGTNQQMIRLDKDCIVNPIKSSEIKSAFLHISYDAIVISDYDKGFLTVEDLQVVCQNFNGPVFIDTKKRDLFTEKNVLFKINQREYNNLNIIPELTNLIVTMGSLGCTYMDVLYEAEKVNVFDVVGAGDTFLSALVYSFLLNGNSEDVIDTAIKFANKASAIAVQHYGCYVLTKDDILKLGE
jgi:D-glycero-beta-D-manno-heptose-7-phosphate kinase